MKRLVLNLLYISIVAATLSACNKKKEDPQPNTTTSAKTEALAIVTADPMKGSIGEQIKIELNKKVTGVQVFFNGRAAKTITATSEKTATVTIPNRATTGKIRVSLNGETTETATDFEIVLAPGQLPYMPADLRNGATGFAIGTKVYIGLGASNNGKYLSDFWELDTKTSTWKQVAGFPGKPRAYAVSFVIGAKAYVGTGRIGGQSGTAYKDFWEYNPTTDTWRQVTDLPGEARAEAVSFVLNNQGYVGTGQGIADKKDFWKYDPATEQWSQVAGFAGIERHAAVSFVANNEAYVGTGRRGSFFNDFWKYTPATDQWTKIVDLPAKGRVGAVGFAIGNTGYVGLGIDNLTNDNGPAFATDFWGYDTATEQWTVKNSPTAGTRAYALSVVVDGQAYIGLGNIPSQGNLNDLWKYTP